MKSYALVVLSLAASASAFAPATHGRSTVAHSAKKTADATEEKKPLFNRIFAMDLFSPVADQNDYGARKKKKLVTGKIGSNSYIPSGLSKEQYEKIRAEQEAKKAAKYQKNAAKAGKFEDFTKWYKERGTDVTDGWIKSVTRGHTMVKTKYDWSGDKDKKPYANVKK